MREESETVGERIKRCRLERGLAQTALACKGVSESYVCRIETGSRNPSVKALREIAKRLGVSAEYLESGEVATRADTELTDAELELRLGDTAKALDMLESAVERAERCGDEASATRARIGLIVAHARLGDHLLATELFEQIPEQSLPPVAARPDLYTATGRAHAAAGDPVRSAAFFRRCLAELEAADALDDALFVRFATQLSYALSDCGDVAAAKAVLVDAVERSASIDDPYTELRVSWSLGRVYATSGDADLAAHYLRRAITLCERTEDRFHLAAAHETLATTYLNDRDPEQALPHLETAERIYTELNETGRTGLVIAERARHALQSNEHDVARELALQALDLLESGKAPLDASGDVWQTLGELYTQLEEHDLAEHCLRTAITTLEGAPAHHRADAYRSLAKLLEATGREKEALEAMWDANNVITHHAAHQPANAPGHSG